MLIYFSHVLSKYQKSIVVCGWIVVFTIWCFKVFKLLTLLKIRDLVLIWRIIWIRGGIIVRIIVRIGIGIRIWVRVIVIVLIRIWIWWSLRTRIWIIWRGGPRIRARSLWLLIVIVWVRVSLIVHVWVPSRILIIRLTILVWTVLWIRKNCTIDHYECKGYDS